MSKSLWVAAALAVSAAVVLFFVALVPAGPAAALSAQITGMQIPQPPFVARLCDAVMAGLVVAFLLIFVLPALADAAAVGGALHRLRQLRLRDPGGLADPSHFRQALRGVPFLEAAATDYLAAIGSFYDPSRSPRAQTGSIPPGGFFGPPNTVDRRLASSLFANMPLAVFGLGLAAGLAQLAAGAALATDFPGEGGIAAMATVAVALALAILLKLAHAGILELRYTQAQRLCAAVDALALSARADPLGDFIALSRLDNRELRETVESGFSRLEKSMRARVGDLAQTITASADASARYIGQSAADALKEPMEAMRESADRLAEDQRERLVATLTEALHDYSDQFSARHGDQAERLAAVLGALADATGRLNDGVAAAVKRFREDMERQSADVGGQLREAGDAALAHLAEIAEKTHADLDRASATGSDLRYALQDLSVSLGPSFRRLVDIQEQLLATIEQENAASRTLSRAAADMSAVARSQREGLEMIVGLAGKLREGTGLQEGRPGRSEAPAAASVPLPPDLAASLGEELRSLREEAKTLSRDAADLPPTGTEGGR
jgi:hypothetical protein